MERRDEKGDTALMLAIKSGNVAKVKFFLHKGAKVDLQNNAGNYPIHMAAVFGNTSIMHLLLKFGADLFSTNTEGRTVLHFAVEGGKERMVKWLIKMGVDVNAAKCGYGCLCIACGFGDLNIIKMLLGAGADVNLKHKEGIWPIHYAVQSRKIRTVQLMLDQPGVDVNVQEEKTGATPLHMAGDHVGEKMVEFLIHNGANIHAKDFSGATPLHSAARKNKGESKFKVIEVLLQYGANPNESSNARWSPFLWCVHQGNARLFKLFHDYNADMNLKDLQGYTLLYVAVNNGDGEMIKLILDLYPEIINGKSMGGWTALHLAAFKGNCACIDILLSSGAEIDVRENKGATPLYLAAARVVDSQSQLTSGRIVNHQDAVKMLLAHGADINEMTTDGKLIIEAATRHEILLRHMAELESQGKHVSCETVGFIKGHVNLNNRYEKYRSELLGMKKCKVFGTVSFFHILTKNTDDLVNYARNEELVDAFIATDLVERFPTYSKKLKDRFSNAIDVQQLIKKATRILSSSIISLDGHHLVFRKILKNFTIEELRVLTSYDEEKVDQ